MNKTEYRDYKYVIQDVSNLYLGAKFTYEEMLEEEEVPFKFKAIIERYIKSEIEQEVSLESHFYHMEPKGFPHQIYKQLKTKVKFSILIDKKSLFGGSKRQYDTKILPLDKFIEISLSDKESQGIFIQEICISKMSLMSFGL